MINCAGCQENDQANGKEGRQAGQTTEAGYEFHFLAFAVVAAISTSLQVRYQ